jgi:hypothetical protein
VGNNSKFRFNGFISPSDVEIRGIFSVTEVKFMRSDLWRILMILVQHSLRHVTCLSVKIALWSGNVEVHSVYCPRQLAVISQVKINASKFRHRAIYPMCRACKTGDCATLCLFARHCVGWSVCHFVCSFVALV